MCLPRLYEVRREEDPVTAEADLCRPGLHRGLRAMVTGVKIWVSDGRYRVSDFATQFDAYLVAFDNERSEWLIRLSSGELQWVPENQVHTFPPGSVLP